ncbi:MAG: beta-ketoacyl-ACP synthase III [Nitrospinota bacterium]
MRASMIVGTGSYVPQEVITNGDLEKMVDTSDEWIVTRTGISERRKASPEMTTSELAVPASLQALEAAGVSADELDLIIVATITPDTYCPSAACWLQNRIGANRAFAFDVNAACSGFIYGLTVADQFIRTGSAERVLFVGAEIMTRVINWEDRSTCILWGDGAGAVVMGPAEDGRGILSNHLHSDGRNGEALVMAGGGSRVTPIRRETVDRDLHTLKMNGPDSFKIAVRSFTEVCNEALNHNGLTAETIDLFVPHQANIRIIDAVAKRLTIPSEKILVTIHKYGNTSSASIPIALDEAVREGRVRPGDKLLLAAFGGGLTWGATTLIW